MTQTMMPAGEIFALAAYNGSAHGTQKVGNLIDSLPLKLSSSIITAFTKSFS
jgi:hypothetical protein